RGQSAKKAVLLIARPRREVEDVGWPRGSAIAKCQTPKPVNRDRLPLRGPHEPLELSGFRKGGNLSTAEVADEVFVTQLSKGVRRARDSPRSIHPVPVMKASHQHTVGRKYVDVTKPGACDLILRFFVLFGEHNSDVAADILHIEGAITGGNL